ncbi:acyl-CoA dehydrogenase [Aeromicrobium panaciterrae]|uniref:acyl-CoA dehydrogenase family protein n=1 Tax=Aeromicrobium panaciterrae TaxID=363861 RepID=UPI0031E37E08
MTRGDKIIGDVESLIAGRTPQADGADRDLWAAQFDAGLAWVHFPNGRGGRGMPRSTQQLIDTRLAEAGFASPSIHNQIGVGLVAGTLITHGTEEQIDRHLRPTFTTDEIWCQLFSEPGAGSDLANLSTSARRNGDSWTVTGEKMWTSFARSARWGLLLARTDPQARKHAGITCFIVDMHDPAVTVRPIRQINGYSRVSEVHLDAVQLADTARVGAVGEGWSVALTALSNERVMLGAKTKVDRPEDRHIDTAVRAWRDHGRDPAIVDELTQVWIRAELVRLTAVRAAEAQKAGTAGPEAAIGKLAAAELEQDIFDLTMEALGDEALLYPGYDDLEDAPYLELEYADPRSAYLSSRRTTIAGGTSEIMRNVLGERVLGLPAEPRVDKDVPWILTKRS